MKALNSIRYAVGFIIVGLPILGVALWAKAWSPLFSDLDLFSAEVSQ